ncbi:MAG: oxygen-independent coproporphyrinogen oxidase, partial [Pedosphaera sp.]|nr:oxygen-independent coproporphyrinogen oxidase [Pedosphaera sp.]
TALGSEHLSSYEVIYEDDTPLYAQLKAGEFDVDEDLACAMYEELIEHSTRAGFHQYEIANFARHKPTTAEAISRSPGERAGEKVSVNEMQPVISISPTQHSNTPSLRPSIPSHACQHNVNYWRGGSFYGLGPSATGYVRGIRTKNWSNTQIYCDQLEKGKRAIETSEQLPPRARAGEIAAFGLRMNVGWPFEQFQQATGWDLRREWSAEIQQLETRGWGRSDPHRFQLTPAGLRFADAAAELFLR